MPTATRTLNPLPLQDLEPHRFEDLVRQLAYDFRDWQKLEATGRAGSDDGFDARGLERVPSSSPGAVDDAQAEEDPVSKVPDTRLWLIQCKREQKIGPKKLREYVESFGSEPIYGVVVAAACDFSKRARDEFEAACRKRGYSEVYLWGKGEIEDALFQPKNDNLLFAYFGISLTLRRRSLQSSLRAVAALKKTLRRVLSDAHLLVFRQTESQYPDLPDQLKPSWVVVSNYDCAISHDGLHVDFRHYPAYADKDGMGWDAANLLGMDRDSHHLDDWGRVKRHPLDAEASAVWGSFERENQGWLHISGRIRYDRILAIDEVGDEFRSCPHIFVEPYMSQLFDGYARFIRPNDNFLPSFHADEEHRVINFPAKMRRID